MAKTYGLMRLGRDAEVRRVGDQQVANLSLAYNYGRKGEDGSRPTQWIDAALWGERAAALAPYLKKGTQHLFTLNDVHIETYTKDGYEAFKLAATVADVELGSNGERQQAPAHGGPSSAPARRPAAGAAPSTAPAPAGADDDSDIPF